MTYNRIELSSAEIESLARRITCGNSTTEVQRAINNVNENRRARADEIRAVIAADGGVPRNVASGHPDAPPSAGPFQFKVPNVNPVRELGLRLAVESKERGESAEATVAAAELFSKFLSGGDSQ